MLYTYTTQNIALITKLTHLNLTWLTEVTASIYFLVLCLVVTL